jgi:signal transduction histidine kinase/ActR/RegA family two-component response regulator
MTSIKTDKLGLRALVFAPIGRDGAAVAAILRRAGIDVTVCADLVQLVAEIEAGAGAVFVAEEAFFGKDVTHLTSWVERQPPWSDLPFIMLTSHLEEARVVAWRQRLTDALRNVSLLERPVQPITLTTSIRAALRARARQSEVRALIADRDCAAAGLEALVNERTAALLEANAELRTQMAERARAEESLRQSQKIEAIGQLTGGVAHDFNNLLMVISGGLEMLRRKPDSTRSERLMDGMQQATQRGAALTKQLLAFSRQQPLKPEPIDVARQIGGMRELLNRSLRGDVHVDFQFASSTWAVEVDAGELELVVLNLVVNARDAMPNGGTITVRAVNCLGLNGDGLQGDYVRLSVSDTGTGMTPDVLARVFEPFFTTKDIGKGTGLGLAQVHGFVTQSRGEIRIRTAPGAGTTIDLYLPRSDKRPQDQPPAAETQIEQPRRGTAGAVLLVEDDGEVAELVSEMLDQLGFEVLCVASANAALGALSNGRSLDLVFSDIIMPGGMNGLQLAREIRARRRNLPILLTSGYSEAVQEEADREGIPILAKPYRLDELSAALKKSLARSNREEKDS